MRGSDKYRFLIAVDGTNYVAVTLAKPVIISGDKSGNCSDFRRKSTEWKFLKHENEYLYKALISLLTDPAAVATLVRVKVDLYDNWDTFTSTEYLGYVTLGGVKINEDTGVIEVSPTEISYYEWYDQHKDDKHDIYSEVPKWGQPITYDITTETEQYFIPTGVGFSAPQGFSSHVGAALAQYSPSVDYTTGYKHENWVRHTGSNGNRAYRCIVDNGPSSTVVIPGVSYDWMDYWEECNVVTRVYRETADLPFYASGHSYIHGNGIFEEGFPAVTTPNPEASNCNQNRYYYLAASTESGTMTVCGTLLTGNTVNSTGPYHDLAGTGGVLSKMLEGSGLTLVSEFFQSATNPVTGESPNPYRYLKLIHNQVVKDTHDYSTTGELTLEQLITDLCNTFQLQWCIDGTSLIIEHYSYFARGKSYTGTPVVYADLTDKTKYKPRYQIIFDLDGSESDNEYSFTQTEAPQKELFNFRDGYDYDGEILYDSAFCKKDSKEERNIASFMTDLAWLYYYKESSIDDCYCLAVTDSTGKVLRKSTGLRWRKGNVYYNVNYTLTEASFPNGYLMWDNLLKDFWTVNNYFSLCHINGEFSARTVTDTKKLKKQRDIRFPRLESGALDPFKLITTNLGDGIIESFDIDTDTDFINVNLAYSIE